MTTDPTITIRTVDGYRFVRDPAGIWSNPELGRIKEIDKPQAIDVPSLAAPLYITDYFPSGYRSFAFAARDLISHRKIT